MTINVNAALQPLWNDLLKDQFPNSRPLLAHYTSIETVAQILLNQELWFACPLFMSDLGELRTGMFIGRDELVQSSDLRGALSPKLHDLVLKQFQHLWEIDDGENAMNVFVLSGSVHNDIAIGNDGLLSMWRGYGKNGSGAAIVIDTAKISDNPNFPIAISKVVYFSDEERRLWMRSLLSRFAELLAPLQLTDENAKQAATNLFKRIKISAIFTKHKGFHEEQEWRALYLKDEDKQNIFGHLVQSAHTPQGPQPKFKLKLQNASLDLSGLIHKIIVGPGLSSPRALYGVTQMIREISPALASKVVASTTPYRHF